MKHETYIKKSLQLDAPSILDEVGRHTEAERNKMGYPFPKIPGLFIYLFI